MTEQEKFQRLIDELGVSVSQFSRDLGFERAEGIYKILRGKTTDPLASTYARIREAYPNVSPDFLLLGIGPVFIKTDDMDLQTELAVERKRNERLEQDNELLRRTLGTLNEVIGKKDEIVTLSPDEKRKLERKAEASRQLRSTPRPLSVGLRSQANLEVFDQFIATAPSFVSGL